jgi:iron(III) transport system substrate-binding protein
MRRIYWTLALALVLTLAATACGANSNTPSSASPSTAATPAAGTAAAPAPSGNLTVYAALTQDAGDAMVKAFNQAYPNVHVNMVVGGSGVLMPRITAEQKAGGVKADVIFLADPTAMDSLASSGVLSDYVPTTASKLPQGLTGKDWAGVLTFQMVIMTRAGISNPPADWSDLTKPALKGKIVIADPSASGTTFGEVGTLSTKYGWQYFQDLKANGAKVEQSTATVGTDIAQGQYDAGITLDSVVRPLLKQGAPVNLVWPASGSIPTPAPVGLTTTSQNLPAAKAFFDWLLSNDGQKEMVTLGYVPALPGIAPADLVPAGTKQLPVDWPTLATQKDAILKQFQSIFGG